MSGVFLSYSRADRALAAEVVAGLRRLGMRVWWDEEMPGVDWQDELATQIETMTAVLVLWTPHSLESKNVKDEARFALNKDKLVNLLAGVESPPFPFDRINGLPLDGWNGRDPHNGWTRLIQTIERLMAKAGTARPGAFTATPAGDGATIDVGTDAMPRDHPAVPQSERVTGSTRGSRSRLMGNILAGVIGALLFWRLAHVLDSPGLSIVFAPIGAALSIFIWRRLRRRPG